MASLNLITENPFTKAYREGTEARQVERLRDQNLQNAQQQYEITEEQRPARLADITASSDFNQSRARVQQGSEGAQIEQSGFNRDTARNNATRSGLELDDYQKNHNFTQSLEMLAKGDIAGAQAYAERNGVKIPDFVLNDTRMQQAVKSLWENAQRMFPNRQRDQVDYLKKAIQQMMSTAGELNYNPAGAINVEGAPTPPEQSYGLLRPTTTPGAPGAGGPLAGKTERERMANIVLSGDPSSPEYAAAYAFLAKPVVSFDPNTGEAIMVNPDMSWARPPGRHTPTPAPGPQSQFMPPQPQQTPPWQQPDYRGTPPYFPDTPRQSPQTAPDAMHAGSDERPRYPVGDMQPMPNTPQAEGNRSSGPTITRQPGRSASPTAATYSANIEQAQNDLTIARNLLFPNGKFDRSMAMTGAGNVPLTQGREARQALRRAVEILLRLRTGAAAPDQEVDNYLAMFMPSAFDSDQGAMTKLQRLEEFFNATAQGDTSATPQPTARPSPPSRAIEALRANPQRAAEFDAKYGAGAAQRVLGQ